MRRTAIERMLPAAFQRGAGPGTVLGALLDVMEAMHAPDEDRLDRLDDLFAPYRTPDDLVPFLARWVALDGLVTRSGGVPVGRLRDLVASGAALAQWRGTAEGLVAMLSMALGATGITIEEPADRPFHFVVRAPVDLADRTSLIRHIVDTQKPAATTYEVVFTDDTKESGS
jgi:phage tail-like protein